MPVEDRATLPDAALGGTLLRSRLDAFALIAQPPYTAPNDDAICCTTGPALKTAALLRIALLSRLIRTIRHHSSIGTRRTWKAAALRQRNRGKPLLDEMHQDSRHAAALADDPEYQSTARQSQDDEHPSIKRFRRQSLSIPHSGPQPEKNRPNGHKADQEPPKGQRTDGDQ